MKRFASFALAAILLAACSQDSGPTALEEPGSRIVVRAYNEISSGNGTVRTDKDDYVPGETITVLGGGWEPGETVVMTITEEPEVQEDLVLTSVADAEGSFANSEFAVSDIHAGVVFTLIAVGQSSGMTASTMFNDGTIGAVTFSFHQGTTSGSPPNGCTGSSLGATPSVSSGTQICVRASFPITGSGATNVQIRWRNPSGTIVTAATQSRSPGFPNGTTSGAFAASTTPTATGTWTALVCQSIEPLGSTTGCQPAGTQRGTATFTVTAADDDAPNIQCTVPDASVWYGADVTVSCTAADPSGLQNPADVAFSLSTDVPGGTETASAQTESREVCDTLGNCTTAGPYTFQVDKKAPSTSCAAPDGLWHATDVSIACTATDGGSGVTPSSDESFSLMTNVPDGTETSNAATDSKTVSDLVGNAGTAGPINGNMVDKKAPEISCQVPGPSFTLNQTPANVNATAGDGGSGPATQNVSAAANTSSVGIHQVGLSATDAVGNTGNKNCGYSVLYAFSGFYQPVDNIPTMNVAKAGQAVPLKWRLQDFFGAPVLNLSLADVEVKTLNCSNGEGTDQVEQYTGASGLQNLGDGYYQYNWKSPKGYAGACKSLNLNLGEGTTHNAFFQFKN
ncbi:MAG TPA: PxKF domain-containing protein [Gemmatimonadota bacterium]|nr:PxKF domain-containing protein [Gemmatimonadota bacterium]